jgi:chitin disaccharide deacetylase
MLQKGYDDGYERHTRGVAFQGVLGLAQGFVIVNADDFGLSAVVTDAILSCFEAGVITSASTMVWMTDSERASSLGREQGLPSGLHLNLDSAFEDARAPHLAQNAQERIMPWFCSTGRHHIVSYNTSHAFRRSLDTSIEFQLDEFRARYGCEPTHIDGHHHVHLAWNVLTSKAIPDGMAMRTTRRSESASPPLRALRSLRERWLRHRFRTTEYFYDFLWLAGPDRRAGSANLDVLSRVGSRTVEVMAHPGAADEFGLLCSQPWSRLIGALPTGSFADLS